MARKRTALNEDRIVALMARGRTAAQITEALAEAGIDTSVATVTRRMRELRGKVRAAKRPRLAAPPGEGKVAPSAPPPPSSPDPPEEAAPSGLALEEYDALIRHYEDLSRAALGAGDESAAQGWARVALQHRVERRKAEPPPKQDPNERPDMVAAARRGREALHKLIVTSPEGS